MIATITLNPSVDRSYILDEFYVNGMFRSSEYHETAGGKGLNVARVAKLLGEEVETTGFLGGRNGQFIEAELDKLGIKREFIRIKRETRCCIEILSGGLNQTEILEAGPSIERNELQRFYNRYNDILKRNKLITASGSLPQNVPTEIYKDLITRAKEANVRFFLDTSGEALKEGIKAAPFLVKPNVEELKALTGASVRSEKEIVDGGKWLCSFGIEIVVISLGAEGAIVINNSKAYRAGIPEVRAVNPVGSGDSMLAGFAVAVKRGYCLEKMIRFASACGTANAMEAKTGIINMDNVNRIMDSIKVNEI